MGVIYVQAKRWDRGTTVGRPEIQRFAGALQGVRAQKGVLQGDYDATFRNYSFGYRPELDGAKLANLMIDFGVGVATPTRLISYEALEELDAATFDAFDETDT